MRTRGALSASGASVLLLALLVLVPIVVLLAAWQQEQWATWQHLLDTVLWRLVGNTLFLMVGVSAGVLLLAAQHGKEVANFLQNAIKRACFVAITRLHGIAVHGVTGPHHAASLLLHSSRQRR